MDGINAIIKDEADRKRFLKVLEVRNSMLPLLPFINPDVYTHCQDDCCECTVRIQENFMKNRRVPQVLDLEDFKIMF